VNRLALFVIVLGACSSSVEHPAENPPPSWGVPISGGTMLITRDGKHAVVADPDRDRIVTVDLASREVIRDIPLLAGDEPGRLAEDAAGRIHIALRRGGAVFTLASPAASEGVRHPVCAEPRGIAVQGDLVHVACTTGELVTMTPVGEIVRTLRLDRDLRDVVVDGGQLYVTRFRTAELLTIDANGTVVDRATPPIVKRTAQAGSSFPDCPNCDNGVAQEMPVIVDAVPAVAWRAISVPNLGVVVSHQRQVKAKMQSTPDGYGPGCGGAGPVEHAVTVFKPGQAPFAVARLFSDALPVDVALSPDGDRVAFVMAGSGLIHQVWTASLLKPDGGENDCKGNEDAMTPVGEALGAPTSVGYLANGTLAVFYPESPAIVIFDGGSNKVIQLPGGFGYDSGRKLFHTSTRSGLACASCHPEGRDDGLVWEFEGIGKRRTQSLAGNILSRAPYHWNGDMDSLDTLMHDVFAVRMSGGEPTRSQKLSLGPWLERIPAPKGVTGDAAAIDRGRALFDSADVACTTCHAGATLSNNQLFDVGTGARFKVPSLVGVSARAPFMHDGCATTLRDRFGACGGGDLHGKTSTLTPAQVADLVAYLESL
jgi:mono/diheme cytochrome c family protein